MKNQDNTPEKKSVKMDKKDSSDKSVPIDLINDLKKGKIDRSRINVHFWKWTRF